MDENILKEAFELLPFTLYADEELLKPQFDNTPDSTYKIDDTVFNLCHWNYYDTELVHFRVLDKDEDGFLDSADVSVCGDEDNATSNSKLTAKKVSNGVIINSKVYLTYHSWNTILSLGGLLQCAVCDEIMTSDEVDDHMSSISHKANLERYQPLLEYELNIVRKIENYYHCGVCNLMPEDISFHMNSERHKQNYLLAIGGVTDKKPVHNEPEHKINKSVDNVLNSNRITNIAPANSLNLPTNNSGSVVKYKGVDENKAPVMFSLLEGNCKMPLPKLTANNNLTTVNKTNVTANLNHNLDAPTNLNKPVDSNELLQNFIKSFKVKHKSNAPISKTKVSKIKPVPSLNAYNKFYNEQFPSLKGPVNSSVKINGDKVNTEDEVTNSNEPINDSNAPFINTPDLPVNNSYASAAKKAAILAPEYVYKEYKNKQVKVKFDSWNMILRRLNKTFYCMACKETNITDEWLHCCCVKHLESLQRCAIVEAFEDFFIREACDKFLHCGHCNNLQNRGDIDRHIATAHPQAKKLTTLPKEEKNDSKTKKQSSRPVKVEVSTAEAKNVKTKVKQSSGPVKVATAEAKSVKTNVKRRQNKRSVSTASTKSETFDSARSTESPQARCDSARSTASPQARCDSARSTASPQARCDSVKSTDSSDSVRTTDSPDTRFLSFNNVRPQNDVFSNVINIRPFDLELKIGLLNYNTLFVDVGNRLCCGLCDCLVLTDPIQHICATWHTELLRLAPFIPSFNNNLIREIRGRLHCALCNIYVTKDNIFTHIMNSPHTVMLTQASGPVQVRPSPSNVFTSMPNVSQNVNSAPNPMWQSALRVLGNQIVPYGPRAIYPQPGFNPHWVPRVTWPIPNMPPYVDTKTPENAKDTFKIVEINKVISKTDDVNKANANNLQNVDGTSKDVKTDKSTSKINDQIEVENNTTPTNDTSHQIEHLVSTVSTMDAINSETVDATSKGNEKNEPTSNISYIIEAENNNVPINNMSIEIEHLVPTVSSIYANNSENVESTSRRGIEKDESSFKIKDVIGAEYTNVISNQIQHLVSTIDANNPEIVDNSSNDIEKDESPSIINDSIKAENTSTLSKQIEDLVLTDSTTGANDPKMVDDTSKDIEKDESISKINDVVEAENTNVPINVMLNQIDKLVPTVSTTHENNPEKVDSLQELENNESTSIINDNIEAENTIIISTPTIDNTLNLEESDTNNMLDTNDSESVDVASSINESELNEITADFNEPYNIEELIYLQFKSYNAKITFNSYNSFIPVGDGTRYCFVCWNQVDDLTEHVESIKHLENMKGCKYMEQYSDNMIRWKNSTHHCSVCNVMIFDDLQTHLSWQKHAAALVETRKTARQLSKDMKKTKYRQFKAMFTKKKYISNNPVKLKILPCDNLFPSSI